MLVIEAVNTPRLRSVRQPQIEFDGLAGSARAGENDADTLDM